MTLEPESTTAVLGGTWPVQMHADRFFGTIKVDGQHPRVAALVCHDGDALALSLVGYDTSVSAALATLWNRETVVFQPDEGVSWHGPRTLRRRADPYKQYTVQLEGTKEMHYIALPSTANIAEGILHPPDLPTQDEDGKETTKIDRTRFVLGNWDEETPNARSFLGTLYGMRALFLHKDDKHPDWPGIWARELWQRGMTRKLIQPLKYTLGIKAWMLSDNLVAWGKLIGDGTREGWLPWRDETSTREEEVALSDHAREIATLQAHAVRDALALAGMLER